METSFHKRWVDLIPPSIQKHLDMTHFHTLRQQSITLTKETNISILGQELESQVMNNLGIPEVLDHLLAYFSDKPERFKQLGIFRKSGSQQDQK